MTKENALPEKDATFLTTGILLPNDYQKNVYKQTKAKFSIVFIFFLHFGFQNLI